MPDSNNRPFDFVGMATAYGVKCKDGRVILHGAFDHQDGQRKPLIWRHNHEDMGSVVGHVILHKRPEGMKVGARFNKTQTGQNAKELVHNQDIEYLSIYANDVKEDSALRVSHGNIREVSLVLAGANPGAVIEEVIIHSDDPFEPTKIMDGEFKIYSGVPITIASEIEHAEEEKEETLQDIINTLNDDQMTFVQMALEHAMFGKAEFKEGGEGPTIKDVFESLNEKQKNVLYDIVGRAVDMADEVKHSDETGESDNMKTTSNVFEKQEGGSDTVIISHDQMRSLISDAMSSKGSLSDVVVRHAGTYGIDNINVLFPDAKNVHSGGPQFIMEDQEWVSKVLGRARHTPFSRIKSMYATITADEARAKGYVTGAEKFEEVFPVFSRVTTPQTIYKKQKLDRDDIIDITDFDVVRWMKGEMQIKLREELARAILIGDGREVIDPDKIKSDNIRPIYGDNVLYSHQHLFQPADDVLDIIDGVVAARENYKGAGSPVLFVAPGLLTSMMLVRDTTNRRIYPTKTDLLQAMLVSDIIEVPFMTGVTRSVDTATYSLLAIMVNMQDYVIGADKGGQTSFFEDFDIDFNQYKYLYESRVSGALVNPKAAIIFEQTDGN